MKYNEKLFAVIVSLIFLTHVSAQTDYMSQVWVADNGDGTYKNPVLYADYSDPDVIRVGNDYYMTASSFNCTPGLPILHSKDLVNWRLINYALKKQIPEEVFNAPQHGKGVWAPSMNYRNGEFYIYYPDPDFGIYMIKTKDPAKEWSQPVLVLAGKGIIDPSSFWDDDGQAYLAVAWAGSRAGVNSLLTVFKMNKEGTKVIDDGKHVYDGHDQDHTVEGPKFFKRNGYYYLLPPAGGVATGWQLALRSRNIYGPYERKVVMDQGNTAINGPHQGALVQTQTGEYWFYHFQDKGVYGRILHLQPVQWKSDWPVIGVDKDGDGKGEPVLVFRKPNVGKVYPVTTPAESDEFTTDTLGLQWQWHANPKIQWSALIRNSGYLRLFAYPSDSSKNLWAVPSLLLQKFPAPDFTATTKLEWNIEWDVWQKKKAGLLVMGNDYAYLSISKNENGYLVSQVICKDALSGNEENTVEQKPLKDSTVYLRVTVSSPDAQCTFSYSEDGINYKAIGKSFTAKPDKWIGAKVGLFCTGVPGIRNGGYADVDWFRITK
ncbi:glycoside hydrolase family 43 protein [Terrimonas pollutisoli]|uniref:glycoside hydrolase family 43 protein n=1 Tax=Terrimonas pollutisoli TaxID=3034147 RepID=UPI0023EB57A7|nr:glycoside hydrolase 43 family protein [Terrimonas sp. H1YJ31]